METILGKRAVLLEKTAVRMASTNSVTILHWKKGIKSIILDKPVENISYVFTFLSLNFLKSLTINNRGLNEGG
jgi:hypothetical protein